MSTASGEQRESAIDRIGEETLELFAANERYNRFLWERLEALAPARGRVLEVGCGIGNITRRILASPFVRSVHALDLDPAYIERLLRAIDDPRLTASATPLEEFRSGTHAAAGDAQYDTIVSSNVLEHIEDDLAAMRTFCRLLVPGGALLLLVPAHPSLYCGLDANLSHFRRYTRADLVRLAREAGLVLDACRHFNPLGILGWWLNGKILRRDVLPRRQLRAYTRLAIPLSRLLDRVNPLPLGISISGLFRRPS